MFYYLTLLLHSTQTRKGAFPPSVSTCCCFFAVFLFTIRSPISPIPAVRLLISVSYFSTFGLLLSRVR
jgi:hypothetical protein